MNAEFRIQVADWRRSLIENEDQWRILGIISGIVFFCMFASASPESVRLLGIQFPTLCGFKLITGMDCPGCGITRALILAFHGRFYDSYLMHIWGVPLALILILQLPYRLAVVLGLTERIQWLCPSLRHWLHRILFISLLLPWAAKTISLLVIWFL